MRFSCRLLTRIVGCVSCPLLHMHGIIYYGSSLVELCVWIDLVLNAPPLVSMVYALEINYTIRVTPR